MSDFKDILPTLQPVYTTNQNDLVKEFYVPVLSEAVSYNRVTGFFSSSALSVAARGLSRFLLNPSSKMRMIVSSKGFTKSDKIEKIYEIQEEIINEFNQIFQNDFDMLEDMIIKKRIAALAWLLKENRLEIKVAKMTPYQFERGILHSKFGILEDGKGIKICFSGSINESLSGWKVNSEVISVYKSTVSGQDEFIKRYTKEFEDYWYNRVQDTTVLDLPDAIKNKLISYSCDDIKEVAESIDPEIKIVSSSTLRYYQEDAIINWLNNNKVGFFEMATGTGKTLTAIFAIKKLIENNPKLGIIIAVPTNPLIVQWNDQMIKEGFKESWIIKCSSDYSNWKDSFRRYILLNEIEQNKLFIFTYQSLYSDEIQEIISNTTKELFLICDEMHHAGAPKFSKCLNIAIPYRLGLSATPIRAHDIEGSQKLLDYFGEQPLIIFDIERALTEKNPSDPDGKTYLCPYFYHFETIELSPREHREYRRLSQLIALRKSKLKGNEEETNNSDKLRALLISCASEKIQILDSIIKKLKNENKHKKLLFYCQSFKSKDIGEKQIESVKRLLTQNNLNQMEFTSKFDDVEYRKRILDSLKTDSIDAVVSIKCLDEGIDLPDIRTAIILASSSNSAEFIQRRGRILRNSLGKEYAEIYDFLVGPPKKTKLLDSDLSLIKREYSRAIEYGKYSKNAKQIKENIDKWIGEYNLCGADFDV